MSKSDENTNELESYGVWVKNNSQQPEDITDTEPKSDDTLDIPEFDDSDFSDMFKSDASFEEPKIEENPAEESFAGDEDSTLTADELMNIANTTQVEEETDESMMFANGEEISNEVGTDEVLLHEFPEDAAFENTETEEVSDDTFEAAPEESFEINPEESVEETAEETFEEPVADSIDESSFGTIEEPVIEDNFEISEESFEEPAAESIEVPAADSNSSDIDLSEFGSITENEASPSPISDEIEINTEDGSSEAEFEEISFDAIDEPAPETNDTEAPKTQLAPGEEEVSLDDFLEDGFSDDSVASGNNGYEPGKEPGAASAPAEDFSLPVDSGSSEEISLDDFIDTSDFGVEVQETSAPAEDTIEEEPVLDMDLSFDDSTDTIETEDNKIESDFSDFTADDSEEFEADTTEESTFSAEEDKPYVADTSNVSTEEVDLSDFGIDSNAEETPVTQNVEEKKEADAVVDYDLSIGDEDTFASAPVISEIKTEEDKEEAEEAAEPVQAAAPAQPDPTTTSILQQIMAELTGLKNDINNLKSEINEVKERGVSGEDSDFSEPEIQVPVQEEIPQETITEEAISEENIAEETAEFEMPQPEIEESQPATEEIQSPTEEIVTESPAEPAIVENNEPAVEESAVDEAEITLEDTSVFEDLDITENSEPVFEETQVEEPKEEESPVEDKGGFFADDDDDTIALSEDELTQIPIDSDSVIEAESETIEDEIPSETVAEEEPVIAETEIPVTDEPAEEQQGGFFTDDGDDTIALSGDELANIMTTTEVTEEASEGLQPDVVENAPIEAEETAINEDLSFDFNDKNLEEEPDIENIQLDQENETEEELPDEISIPKSEDIVVESNETDFMDSVNSTTEEVPASEETVFETTESIFGNDDNAASENSTQFDSPDTLFEEHFDTTDTLLSDLDNTEPAEVVETESLPVTESPASVIEEPSEPVTEETSIADDEIPTVEKLLAKEPEPAETAEISSEFAEVDNLDTNISKDNIDYLNSDKENVLEQDKLYTSEHNTNDDLKRDIKSVLLYMDQLLENLPEEKIMEFAKSDEFVTYKKLFSELGLS
ncbi:hypothetical protein [Treponema sp. C6A8]|uniref:hypothetical protein n=1 Tax=Treponema sp. C6A8 TaxID=1410609 RepID=UPI000480DD8D|nr:hypothetical protein [Treponema sp. C6A8]